MTYLDLTPLNNLPPMMLLTYTMGLVTRMFFQVGWLPSDDRARLEATYGHWATSRAEAMIPPAAGVSSCEAAAKHMYEKYQATIGVPAAPRPPVQAPAPRPRKAGLTPEEVESMGDDILAFFDLNKRWPELADIVVWVEEKFDKSITEEAAKAVLDAARRRSR
jgi:hypothetical protein